MPHPELETLFREYADFVYRICHRYTRDKAEAEDLTQEIFCSLPRKLGGFKGQSKLGTWLYRIAVNACLEHLRKKWRRKELDLAYLDSRVIANISPEGDRVLAKIDLEKILGRIGARNRQVLFLALAEGLSYQETAEVCGMGREAVAKMVNRFLAKARARGSARSQGEEARAAAPALRPAGDRGERTHAY